MGKSNKSTSQVNERPVNLGIMWFKSWVEVIDGEWANVDFKMAENPGLLPTHQVALWCAKTKKKRSLIQHLIYCIQHMSKTSSQPKTKLTNSWHCKKYT